MCTIKSCDSRDIDFDKLMKRELEPPFNPKIRNEMDTKFIPKNYNHLEAKDSITEVKGPITEKAEFKGFTYAGESHLA